MKNETLPKRNEEIGEKMLQLNKNNGNWVKILGVRSSLSSFEEEIITVFFAFGLNLTC